MQELFDGARPVPLALSSAADTQGVLRVPDERDAADVGAWVLSLATPKGDGCDWASEVGSEEARHEAGQSDWQSDSSGCSGFSFTSSVLGSAHRSSSAKRSPLILDERDNLGAKRAKRSVKKKPRKLRTPPVRSEQAPLCLVDENRIFSASPSPRKRYVPTEANSSHENSLRESPPRGSLNGSIEHVESDEGAHATAPSAARPGAGASIESLTARIDRTQVMAPKVSDVEARAELCTSSGFEPVHVTAAYHDLFSLAALRAPVPSAESAPEHASMQFMTASTDAQPSPIDSVSLLGATVNPALEGDASVVGSSATANSEHDDAQCATETTLSTATRSLISAVPPADDMAAPTLCSKAETATSTTTLTVGLLASPQVLVAQQPQQQHPREKKKSGCSLFRCFRRHRDSED